MFLVLLGSWLIFSIKMRFSHVCKTETPRIELKSELRFEYFVEVMGLY